MQALLKLCSILLLICVGHFEVPIPDCWSHVYLGPLYAVGRIEVDKNGCERIDWIFVWDLKSWVEGQLNPPPFPEPEENHATQTL